MLQSFIWNNLRRMFVGKGWWVGVQLLVAGITFTSAVHSSDQLSEIDLGPYKVEDFARLPKFQQVGLSKEGTYFSAISKSLHATPLLAIENLNEAGAEPFYVSSKNWKLNWYRWLSDTELLLSVMVRMRIGGTPASVTRLVLVDVPSRELTLLFRKEKGAGFRQIQDRFLGTVPERPGHFLISGHVTDGRKESVYLAKFNASKLPKRPYQRSIDGVHRWRADATGNVRVGRGYTADQKQAVLLLKDGDGEWHDYYDFAEGFEVVGLPADKPDEMYVQVQSDGAFGEVRQLTVSTRTLGDVVASHPLSDVSRLVMNEAGDAIDYVVYASEQVPHEYRNAYLRRLQATVDKHLDDTSNYIAARAADNSRALIGAYSGELAPHFYIFDAKSRQIAYIGATYPELLEKAPGKVYSVSFAARDGLQIPGYLTLPKDLDPDAALKLPFVVFPHGGPAARDFLRFDWMAQMMTAAGYGVLQINFRGSTGYGLEFERAGRKQWGQAMQDDITDGTRWLIEQDLAAADQICIFGASYGGYAALMGAVKEPELYRCAASLNGVTDLPSLIRREQRYLGGRFATRFIGRLWKDRKMLRENSPLRLAEQVNVPVLLVHGDKDLSVPVGQSRRMKNALGSRLYDYVELKDGDHYLSNGENRLRFANSLMAFLAEHLAAAGTDSPAAAAATGR